MGGKVLLLDDFFSSVKLFLILLFFFDLALHTLKKKLGVDARLLQQVLEAHVTLLLHHLAQLMNLRHKDAV